MDRNGYNPSIIHQGDIECYLCGVPFPLERHEIFGAFNRQKSKRDGLWVSLCPICHRTGKQSVHNSSHTAKQLKARAEFAWCEKNGKTPDDFIKEFGRNYL